MTIKAFIIVALVFGVFTMGPIIVTIIGIGLAIVAVRYVLIAEKEEKDGRHETRDSDDFSGFAGGKYPPEG